MQVESGRDGIVRELKCSLGSVIFFLARIQTKINLLKTILDFSQLVPKVYLRFPILVNDATELHFSKVYTLARV